MLRRLLPLKLGPVESLYAYGGMHLRGFLQYLDANFNEALDHVTIPSHPLLLRHALCDDFVDRRLGKPGRYFGSLPVAFVVVRYRIRL